jgi:hypothetical protein
MLGTRWRGGYRAIGIRIWMPHRCLSLSLSTSRSSRWRSTRWRRPLRQRPLHRQPFPSCSIRPRTPRTGTPSRATRASVRMGRIRIILTGGTQPPILPLAKWQARPTPLFPVRHVDRGSVDVDHTRLVIAQPTGEGRETPQTAVLLLVFQHSSSRDVTKGGVRRSTNRTGSSASSADGECRHR